MILTEFSKYLLDATHGFDDVFVAGSVAHTEAVGVAKRITADGGYMAFFKQVHGQVGGVPDGGAIGRSLAVETAALGE